jgi:P pilus assembly chaperone PapD
LGILVSKRGGLAIALSVSAILLAQPAAAELTVSQLIIEFKPGSSRTSDIEVANSSPERSYVVVEPREIMNPGTASEQPFTTPDPSKLGLLVSPARFILEPNQRRTLRVSAIGATEHERIYRITIRPVTGEVDGSESGLKLLVGYDLLVLARPPVIRNDIRTERNGTSLTLINSGNVSVEIVDGKQCDDHGGNCKALPSKRLYAGASWKQTLPRPTSGEYRIRSADGWSSVKF